MEPVPLPAPESQSPEVPHRRRRTTTWQRIPRTMKILVAVCLGLLGISYLLQGWVMGLAKRRHESAAIQPIETVDPKIRVAVSQTVETMSSKLSPIDLELSGTFLNRQTHRIEGVVVNKSDRPYLDIRITFALPSADLMAQDQAIVTIGKLGAQSKVKFVSDPIAPEVRQWALVGITATR